MMIQGVSIPEMINQSMTVLTKPSVQSFVQYERRGGMREALTYVGVAAAAAAIAGFLFGLLGGIGGAIIGLLSAVFSVAIGYFVFSYVLYFVGKQQGGTGTQDEVFYTTALYIAPLQAITGVIGAIPLLGFCFIPVSLALALYSVYLGYLASRSSMNLDQNKAIISVVLAVLASWLVSSLLVGIVVGLIATLAGITGSYNTY